MNSWFLRGALGLIVVLGAVLVLVIMLAPGGEREVQIGDRTVTSQRATVVDPSKEDTGNVVIQPSPEFLIEYAFGDGLDGFNILVIQADGSGEYTYWDKASDSARQKKLAFEVSPEQLEAICSQLNQSGFMALASEYRGDDANGTQIAITVVSGHVEKEVYCDNHFPMAVVTLADYLEKEVIQPQRKSS